MSSGTLLLTLLTLTLADIDTISGVILRIPPSITEEGPDHVIYRTDATITLPCKASGTPTPQYEWKKNGADIYLSNNIKISDVDGTMTINPITSLDEGFYQCFAFNSYGTTMTGVSHLQRAVLASYSGGAGTMTHMYDIKEGEPLTVRCEALLSQPKPKYSWVLTETSISETNIALNLNRRVTIDENGYLYFAYVTKSDERDNYLYKCNVFNNYLDQTTGGSYSQINVLPGDGRDSRPEKIYDSPSTVVALVGDAETRLKCFFSGKPTPRIDWERTGSQLPQARNKKEAFDSELVIMNVQEEDQGEYSCTGRNTLGKSAPVKIFLDVQARPAFVAGWEPVDKNATEAEDHVFNCKATAEPAADIAWLVNGAPVNYNDLGPGRSISADRHTFTVSNLCKDCPPGRNDLMVVQCNASNVHGYVFASGYLNVLVATKITVHPKPVEVTVGTTEKVEFNCSATTDDSTPLSVYWEKHRDELTGQDDVRLYPNMDPRVTINDKHTLMINVKNMSITDVNKHYAGEYQCVASNTYSEGIALAKLTVVGAPDPPAELHTGGIGDLWWVFLIIVLLFLIFILCLCCCICCQRNKGDTYPVDEKERANGNDPERELERDGFQDYQRPEDNEPVKGSRASLTSTIKLDSDDDGSLNEYGDIDAMKFNEDGSFIGQYATDDSKKRLRAANTEV